MFRPISRSLTRAIRLYASVGIVATLGLLTSRETVTGNDDSEERDIKSAETEFVRTVSVDLGKGVKMEFMLIPAGKFMMGSPPEEKDRRGDEDRHEVEITRSFYLAKYSTTQEQYEATTGKNPSWFSANGGGKDKVAGLDTKHFPVECVSWIDAKECCALITKNDNLKRQFCLPTEAEWEYACRARTTTPFYFGSMLNGKQANCDGNHPYGTDQKGPYLDRTTNVGSYAPNAWGLYDMHGNIGQWCEDYYGPYRGLSARDPLQNMKQSENRRILRGGPWISSAENCRAAYRGGVAQTLRTRYLGFRVAFRLN